MRLSASLLTACGGSIRYVDRALPTCADPLLIPATGLDDQRTEILWARDRAALVECKARNEVLSGRGRTAVKPYPTHP